MKKNFIYFDNNSTTPIDPLVEKECSRIRKTIVGNPSSSLHIAGEQSRDVLAMARKMVADSIGCDPEEVIFTSGATESNNLALMGLNTQKRTIITSNVEHPCIKETCDFMKQKGFKVVEVGVCAEGLVPVLELRKALEQNKNDLALVTIMHVNNEMGAINDLRLIGEACKEFGVPFHTDSAQGVGKMRFNVKDLHLDMLSGTAHKFHGPKGVGFLYVSKRPKRIRLSRLFNGGHQERNIRPGTIPTDLCFGLGFALKVALEQLDTNEAKLLEMQRFIFEEVIKINGVCLNGPSIGPKRISNNLNFSFHGIEGESMMVFLGTDKICVSSGSACTSDVLEPSGVIIAISGDIERAHCSIRVGLSKFNSFKECKIFVDRISVVVKKLRRLSPIIKDN